MEEESRGKKDSFYMFYLYNYILRVIVLHIYEQVLKSDIFVFIKIIYTTFLTA